MGTGKFNVIISGKTLNGQDITSVAVELAKLIKRDIAVATNLLGGQSTKIKSDVDAATGERYIQALERIGVAALLAETEAIGVVEEAKIPVAHSLENSKQLLSIYTDLSTLSAA